MAEPPSPEWELICQALIDLVIERGYQETTIAAIVVRAGVPRADFDRHFSSKEDCFIQAYWKYVVEAFERRVFAAFQRHDAWRDGLRASAYETVRFIRDNPREAQFGSIEMMGAGAMAQVHRERQLQHIVDLIDRGRQQLGDPDSMTRATAEGVLGSVYTTIVKELDRGGAASIESLVPELMYIAVRPYLGHEAAREELSIPPPAEFDEGRR